MNKFNYFLSMLILFSHQLNHSMNTLPPELKKEIALFATNGDTIDQEGVNRECVQLINSEFRRLVMDCHPAAVTEKRIDQLRIRWSLPNDVITALIFSSSDELVQNLNASFNAKKLDNIPTVHQAMVEKLTSNFPIAVYVDQLLEGLKTKTISDKAASKGIKRSITLFEIYRKNNFDSTQSSRAEFNIPLSIQNNGYRLDARAITKLIKMNHIHTLRVALQMRPFMDDEESQKLIAEGLEYAQSCGAKQEIISTLLSHQKKSTADYQTICTIS